MTTPEQPQPDLNALSGRISRADAEMIAATTGGGVRSRELQAEFADDDALTGFEDFVLDPATFGPIEIMELRTPADVDAAYERGFAEGRRLRAEQLDAATRATYEDGKGDGRAEGRRQAAEGFKREEVRVSDRTVVSRLVGPWEPAEQASNGFELLPPMPDSAYPPGATALPVKLADPTALVPAVLTGDVGVFVTGHWCDRCGDTNFDPQTRECQTCADPDHPCSRAYLDGQP